MANLISLFRVLLCFTVITCLFIIKEEVYLTCFALTILVILLDGLDGYVARKLNECSKLGSVIDILGDRIVEQVYWITFLALGWLPLWVPLVVITRGILVDGLRSLAFEKGFTAFGESSMMQSPLGSFLVSSRFSRLSYGVFKALAFCLMILAHTPGWHQSLLNPIELAALISAYSAVFFCIVRGIPVLIEARRFFT